MKWRNHKIQSFVIGFFLSKDFVTSIVISAGSIFPDLIEGKKINSRKFHRTVTHWFPVYLIPLILVWLWNGFSVKTVYSSMFYVKGGEGVFVNFLFWFLVGCLLHVVQDALTGNIPILHPAKKRKIVKISKTGGILEYVLTFLLIVAFVVYLKIS